MEEKGLFERVIAAAKQINAAEAKPILSFRELQFELFGLCTGIYCQRVGIENHGWTYDKLSDLILSLFARTLE